MHTSMTSSTEGYKILKRIRSANLQRNDMMGYHSGIVETNSTAIAISYLCLLENLRVILAWAHWRKLLQTLDLLTSKARKIVFCRCVVWLQQSFLHITINRCSRLLEDLGRISEGKIFLSHALSISNETE